jgi:DNA-directed RNA polymerase subunit RPC12/RpoP
MQIQEFDRYTAYPVWVKMTTGERKGKTYGFKYDELEVIAPDRKPVGVETSIAEHLKEILDGIGEQLAGGETAVRIGAPIRIIKCGANPRMEGLMAEIVDMQIQEYDRYAVYPVWAKITYGEYEGKVCGFHYDEFVVLPKVTTQGETKEKLVERLEETLNTIRIGRLVKIKKCDSLPELVGEQAEIFDMQIQEYDLYATYPLWVKMISGERKGKVYGFQYDEIEICPRISKSEIKPASFPKQIEEILSRITTLDEVSEIERVIREVKGKVVIEPERQGFWHDKTPCWQMLRCPEAIRNECPAFKHQDTPCWQIEGTYSKLHEYGARGDCTKICENCRVYKRYGNAEPIEIKLRGRGLNQALMEEAAMKAYTKCPGSNGRHLRVDLYNCPKCGAGVEIFSDEITVQCQKCGEKVYREMSPSYVKG